MATIVLAVGGSLSWGVVPGVAVLLGEDWRVEAGYSRPLALALEAGTDWSGQALLREIQHVVPTGSLGRFRTLQR